MTRAISLLIFIALMILSACSEPSSSGRLAADGKPLPNVYKIRPGQKSKIEFRMLDSVNALRSAAGVGPVDMSPQLNAAAATHSRDMSSQNRPWHFGSDGSSPIQRVQRTGYPGMLVGEVISESFETELETLAAWMEQSDTRSIIVDPKATNMGFAWYQERNGKLWWTLVMGS